MTHVMNNVLGGRKEREVAGVFILGCGNTLKYVLWETTATDCTAYQSKE